MIVILVWLCLLSFIKGLSIHNTNTNPIMTSAALSCYAANKNKEVILEVLQSLCTQIKQQQQQSVLIEKDATNQDHMLRVLEIASGTGEHLHCFANNINDIYYQPTEPQHDMQASINAWISLITNKHNRICPPIIFDVTDKNYNTILPSDFTANNVNIMICINMIHISPIKCTYDLFELASKVLDKNSNGYLLTYGPYSIDGSMVDSNIAFDQSLKSRNIEWGIRDLKDLEKIAMKNNMILEKQINMPSNNMCLIFKNHPNDHI